jgi:hypothetical protein
MGEGQGGGTTPCPGWSRMNSRVSSCRLRAVACVCALAVAACLAGAAGAAAQVHISPAGSDSNPCSAAAPCRSFDRAYRAAAPGQAVEAAPGSYGSQAIRADGSKTSGSDVVFRPAAGGGVSVGTLNVDGSHVSFENMSMSAWAVREGAADVTFRNVRAGLIFITSARDVSVLGGEVGPADSSDPQIKAANTSGAAVPTNILIDGVDFHDFTRRQDPNAHVECLQFGAGENVTIRNSRFRNCETQGLFIRSWGGTARIRNFVIENNFFDRTTVGYYPLRVSTMAGVTYDNIKIRYNSGLQSFIVDPGSATNVEWVGNFAPREQSMCTSSQTFRYNVWDDADCSATDKKAAGGFLAPLVTDLHLLPTSPAVGAGDPNDHPATDIDGHPRGDDPDAGADELWSPGPGGPGSGGGNDVKRKRRPGKNAGAALPGRAMLTGRRLRISIACRAKRSSRCKGRLLVRVAGRRGRIASKKLSLKRGQKKTVRLKLSKAERRAVRRRGRIQLAFVTPGSQNRWWQTAKVRVRRR